MRINQVIDHRHQSIFEDKMFVKQFSLLLILIMATSSFLIYHSIYTVNHISEYNNKQSFLSHAVTLNSIEREVNGNVINLEIVEDDFSDLAQLELAQLKKKLVQPVVSHTMVRKTQTKDVHTAKSVIHISSVEVGAKKHQTSIKILRKKFQKTNNIKYAMQLAKRFYEVKKYNSALKWALISNEIDAQKPQSWILFAKSKVMLGKKKDAINALSAYLKMYSSTQISKYLQKLRTQA